MYLHQLSATEDVISNCHRIWGWISYAVTNRLVSVHPLAWLANTHYHDVCTTKSQQRIISAHLTPTLVAPRPQTPPNIDRDYLCNRLMKRFRLYRTQWIETEAVNPIHSICGNFNLATEASPCSVGRSMLPLPGVVTLRNTIGRKVDALCEAKTIVIGQGDAGRHKKSAKNTPISNQYCIFAFW